uniref:Vacuolar protein 8 n=1 Tax=Emiliania huxleyi TaxID=2903 RepID=A0A7S3TW48_EMIHU
MGMRGRRSMRRGRCGTSLTTTIAAGGIELFVAMARDGNEEQKENAVGALANLDGNDMQKEEAAGALVNLSMNDDISVAIANSVVIALSVNHDNSVAIAAAGGIEALVSLARDGNEGQKEEAAGALWNLAIKRPAASRSLSSANDDNEAAIVAAGGIDVLVSLARDGNEAQKERAAGALRILADNDDNEAAIAAAGGVEVLVSLARTTWR